MRSISIRQYRVACVLAILFLAMVCTPLLGVIPFTKQVAVARNWKYFEAILSSRLLLVYAVLYFFLIFASLVGMLRFWGPSRWVFAFALTSSVVLRPFLGLAVLSAYEAFFSTLFGYTAVWLATVSFWTPIADRFHVRE